MVFLPLGGALRKWAYVLSVTTGHVSHCLNLCVFSGTTLWMGLSLCPRVTSACEIFPRNFVLTLTVPGARILFSGRPHFPTLCNHWFVYPYLETKQLQCTWVSESFKSCISILKTSQLIHFQPIGISADQSGWFSKGHAQCIPWTCETFCLASHVYIYALALYSTCDS